MDCSNVISIPYIEGDDRNCPYQYKDARKHFQEHGWVVVEDLLTEKEFHQFSKTYKEHHMYRRPSTYKKLKEDITSLKNVSLDAIQGMWEDNESLRELAFHPKISQCAASLLGIGSVRVLQDQSNSKPPYAIPTHVHQDHPYLPIAEPLTVAAWVVLSPEGSRNCRLGYVSGSHRCGLKYLPFENKGAFGNTFNPPFGHKKWDTSISILEHPLLQTLVHKNELQFPLVKPGSVAFHHGLCLHASEINNSDKWRHAYTTTYCGTNCTAGSCLGIEIKNTASHYFERSGLKHGERLLGEGADELMPIAWPQLHPWELPPRPKRNGHVIERVMKKITNSGYLPSGPTKGIRHESKL